MSIQLSKDNHNSWVTFTTSAECKTVIIASLTVMSGMDPHTISGNLGWVMVKSWVGLGCVEVGFIRLWVGHDEILWRDRDRYLKEVELLLITSIYKA
jgi:hypothetical protein